jgi:hypothetical protein
MVAKIATGEVGDDRQSMPVSELRAEAGKRGGQSGAVAVNSRRRTEIAKKAATARRAGKASSMARSYPPQIVHPSGRGHPVQSIARCRAKEAR